MRRSHRLTAYSVTASWSATPLADPTDDDVNSSASFHARRHGGYGWPADSIRIRAHHRSIVPGYWRQWKRSLDELGLMREHTDTRYIFSWAISTPLTITRHSVIFLATGSWMPHVNPDMGLRSHGPTNRAAVPMFAGIDHVVLDQGMKAGQCKVGQSRGL